MIFSREGGFSCTGFPPTPLPLPLEEDKLCFWQILKFLKKQVKNLFLGTFFESFDKKLRFFGTRLLTNLVYNCSLSKILRSKMFLTSIKGRTLWVGRGSNP